MCQSSEPDDEFDGYLQHRVALEQVRWEFDKLSGLAPKLYHRVFYSPDDPLDPDSWSAFIEANRAKDNWECWEPSQSGLTCGCYFGDQKYLEQFRRLAQSGYAILKELTLRMARAPVPTEIIIALPPLDGHLGWLDLLHDTADFGAALLKERLGFWQLPEACTEEDVPEPYLHVQNANGDCRYPAHPFFRELQHDLFLSSVQAIDIWLLADQAISIGNYLDDPPIALPSVGPHTAVETPIADYLLGTVNQSSASEPTRSDDEGLKPTWDAKLGQLRVGGEVIRQFKDDAEAQTELLAKFEQEGWPPMLADPFEIANVKTDAEAVGLKNKRRGLISLLNRDQKRIRFVSGPKANRAVRGKAVGWRFLPKPEEPAAPPTS